MNRYRIIRVELGRLAWARDAVDFRRSNGFHQIAVARGRRLVVLHRLRKCKKTIPNDHSNIVWCALEGRLDSISDYLELLSRKHSSEECSQSLYAILMISFPLQISPKSNEWSTIRSVMIIVRNRFRTLPSSALYNAAGQVDDHASHLINDAQRLVRDVAWGRIRKRTVIGGRQPSSTRTNRCRMRSSFTVTVDT